MLRCLVVDDEPLGREGLADYIAQLDFLELIGLCENAIEASNVVNTQPVDLIFLDIQMPKLGGLEFLRSLENPPLVIICTAYPSYAIEGYNLNVLDYLVKPVTFQRFLKASQKAKSQHQLISNKSANSISDRFLFVKCENKFEKIFLRDILYVEAYQNYVKIHCSSETYLTLLSLKSIKSELADHSFIQTHKSFIVNTKKIKTVEGNQILIGNSKVPISRSLKTEVYHRIFQDRILKK